MTTLRLTSPLTLTAAGIGKPRRFSILAYSGGMLPVDGFEFPVVVDLTGLSSPDSIPILADHENRIESTLGQTDTITNTGREILLAGPITIDAPRPGVPLTKAQQVLARSSHHWRASIGLLVQERQEIPAGQRVTVNGQTFTGPIIVARRSQFSETSVLAMGADATTSVNLSASFNQKGNLMAATTPTTDPTMPTTFEAWIAALGLEILKLSDTDKAALLVAFDAAQNPPTPPSGNTTAAALVNLRAAANHQRIADIERLAAGYPAIASTAIVRGWSIPETEIAVLKASQRQTAPSNLRAYSSSDHGSDPSQVLQAAFLQHLGQDSVGVKTLGAETMQRGRDLRCTSMMDVVKASFQLHGVDAPHGQQEMLRAAFSTMSLPGVLGNAANKLLLDSYNAYPSVARLIAKKLSANDFKVATGYRMTAATTFEELGPAGEIKHGTFKESAYPFSVSTYAKMFGITRQAIINDDMGAFASMPQQIGRGSAEKVEDLFWTLVLANTSTFFGSGNKNYISGGTSPLSGTALGLAVEKMLKAVDENGKPISVFPKYLIVPPELKVTADSLYQSHNLVGGSTPAPEANPFFGLYQPLTTPYLSNASYIGNSALSWYLFGNPADVAAFGIAYLNGQENPTVESADADFSTLGIQFRGFLDVGVCQIDPRGAVKSAGA